MKNDKFQNLLKSDRFTLVISFIIAVTLWSIVVTFFSTEARTTIEDVPINFDYNASFLNLELEIIEKDIETVDVVVTGPRNVIGSLTKDDIIVYPNVNNVKMAGKYDLSLNAVKKSSIKEYTASPQTSPSIMAISKIVIRFLMASLATPGPKYLVAMKYMSVMALADITPVARSSAIAIISCCAT